MRRCPEPPYDPSGIVNIDWIWAENIRSPSIFSLPLMNIIGPLALPETSFRKSTPSIFRVTRGSDSGAELVEHVPSETTASHTSSPPSGRPVIFQWITADWPPPR